MKTFKYLMMAAAALLLTACGGDADVITPTTEKINGPLGDYFEVVNKDYKVVKEEDSNYGKISVEIKRIKDGLPVDCSADVEVGISSFKIKPGFTIEIQDADGIAITKDSSDPLWDKDELQSIIDLRTGESASITFNLEELSQIGNFKLMKITSTFEGPEESQASSSTTTDSDDSFDSDDTDSNDETANSSSDDSEDWDAVLDSYDSYVTKYIALMKKASKGDASAMAEYSDLMSKAQELGDKLSNAQGSMSASQCSRYMKITQKMASAAM